MNKIAQLLDLISRDLKTYELGGDYYRVCNPFEGFGLVVPLDWADGWIPEYKKDWENFMNGQTFCEYGFYVRDVCRFLRSKQ